MKLCKPYRKAQRSHITQGFSQEHRAIDWAFRYGEFLLAPERCQVDYLSKAELDESLEPLRTGYGIRMKSLTTPHFYHSFIHTLPVFPVKVGDIVEQGQPVAQMGNSGEVYMLGKWVKLTDRLKYPYPGTHLHQILYFINTKGERTYVNPLKHMDWTIKIRPNIIFAIQRIINRIFNILKADDKN